MNKTDKNVCFHSPYILEGSKDNTETKKKKKKKKGQVSYRAGVSHLEQIQPATFFGNKVLLKHSHSYLFKYVYG